MNKPLFSLEKALFSRKKHGKMMHIHESDAIIFDIQLFADQDSPTGQKTEDATPKKVKEAREKGQVSKSQELNMAIILLAGFLSLRYLGVWMRDILLEFCKYIFSRLTMPLDQQGFQVLLEITLYVLGIVILPFLAIILFTALGINLAQVGFLFTMHPLKPDLTKLNPVSGLKRLFKVESLVKLAKALVKITVIGIMPYLTLKKEMGTLSLLSFMELPVSISIIATLSYKIAMQVIILLLILSSLDWLWQRHQYKEGLKMSKYDVKQERKQQEGDPKIKARMRQKMRQTLMKAMKQSVPEADVVITNPIHLAIALKWAPGTEYYAPWVVAKGAGKVAERIKEIARENHVPIRENKPVAQALFKTCEIGDQIPVELYQIISEILAMVYEADGRSHLYR